MNSQRKYFFANYMRAKSLKADIVADAANSYVESRIN